MNRRTVLVALGSATAATAGCLARSEPGSTPTDDSPGSGGTDEPTETREPSETEQPTDSEPTGSGPTDSEPTDTDGTGTPETGWPDGRFADEPCPSFAETDGTVCYHTLDYGFLWVEPSQAVFEPTTGDGSVETIQFTLHNETGDPFGLNPHAWAIKRRTDDGWTHVAPDAHVEPWVTVEDGETYTWVLSVEQDTAMMAENEQAITVDLDSGVHAFAIAGQDESRKTESEGGDRVECIALFEVDR